MAMQVVAHYGREYKFLSGLSSEKNLLRFWGICGLEVEDCGRQVGNWPSCCVFIDLA